MSPCPKCQASLQGEPIPLAQQEAYGGVTHFDRRIAVYDRDLDRTMAWKCPDCGHEWPRKAS